MLRIETSTDSVLDQDSESWSFYKRSQDLFGGDELVVVALSSDEPFSPWLLQQTIRLTEELSGIEGVRRVDSLATVPLIRASPDGSLLLTSSLDSGVPGTPILRASLLASLKVDRIAPRSLISDDGRVAALNVYLEAELTRTFENVISDISNRAGASHTRISGVPIFRTQINLHTGSEVVKFSVLTVLTIAALFWLLFGSIRGTTVPILVGGLGGWLILGIMGFLGIPLSLSTMILPSILLALGCAYSTHYVYAIGREVDRMSRHRAANEVALPVALSGLTTAIGFLGIASVRIEALQQVGGLGALGALITTALVLSLAPALLDRWPPTVNHGLGERIIGGHFRAIIICVVAYPKTVVTSSVLLAAVGAFGIGNLSLETDATKWFLKGSPIRDAYEGIRSDLAGISPINIVIEGREDRVVTEPRVIESLDKMTRHLQSNPDVGKALSIADPLLSVHNVFQPGNAGIESQDLAEQYMLLLSSEEQIWDFIDPEHRRANVLIRADDNGSDHLLAIAKHAEDWWLKNGVDGFTARATGIMYEFGRAENEIAQGQILGVQIATISIALLLLAIFRSVELAGAALLVNAVPMMVAFGGMGWMGIPLDAGTVLVANLALGIAVDDTIHFAAVYESESSLDGVLRKVLPSIASTTLAVGAGFCVLGFSQFAFTRNLGILTAFIMALCFLADVFLLPSLLSLGGRRRAANRS